MSENWNVDTVADSKPEAPAVKPPEAAAAAIPSVLSNEHSLGKIMAMAREARGFSREQAASASNIPGYYLTMIETDDYSSIADQLYLLPFLRRYAIFVALEPEEVASRFIRDVQRADMNPGRVSEPIVMIADRKYFPWEMVLIASAAIVIIGIAVFGYRHLMGRKSATPISQVPVAAAPVAPETVDSAPPLSQAPASQAPASQAPLSQAPPSASAASGSGSAGVRPQLPAKPH
jgi:cytoskeletal protein RodZ